MTRRRSVIAIAVAIALLVLGAGTWYLVDLRNVNTNSLPMPVYTPSAAVAGDSTPTAVAPSVPAGCDPTATAIVPTSFAIDQMNVKSDVLSLGWDNGAAAAPPKDASHTVGWFNEGPKPGSSQGKVLLTIHTYHNGGALGNELNDAKTGLKAGDVLRLSDGAGHTMCYSFDHALKVWVKDYDPSSGLIYDNAGAPMVVIVICWDYSWTTGDWDSRILFYATPLFTY